MEKKEEQLKQTLNVLRSFWRIQRRFGKWGQATMMNSDLSMPQFLILQTIPSGKIVPQKYLGERLLFPKSTLSTGVDGLVSLGLLERIISEENRREVQLRLTEAGERQVQLIYDDPNGMYQKMDRVLAELPQESIDTLLSIHQQVYELMMEEETMQDGGAERC
ncbi:MarR family winged helix-turn-helix transcriptional regulator [Ectobacillus panaciterrae]|uniref:MarR family winged helix-turn-helix transcriptional regulator n=1 Tax=Ectobacillus panaciterrae TaxID=363872 RepID=UPI0004255D44|nr:MarR family transcriptional regulator [Ectobacillus panaciterrae]